MAKKYILKEPKKHLKRWFIGVIENSGIYLHKDLEIHQSVIKEGEDVYETCSGLFETEEEALKAKKAYELGGRMISLEFFKPSE